MDKVEKFKKIISEIRKEIIWDTNDGKWFDKKTNELLKMYEEKQEKPVIRCNYELSYGCFNYRIRWKGETCHQEIFAKKYEEKDGMLITDDFIFIKEELK